MSNRSNDRPAAGDAKQDDATVQQISDSVSRIAIGDGNQRRELIVDDEGQVLQEVEDDEGRGPGDDEDDGDVGELEWQESAGFEEGKDGTVEDSSRLVLDRHTDSVYSICARASAPGLVVTGGGDDKGYLWRYNRETFQLESVIPLEGHTDSVTSVGISADGKFVSTAALDGTVRIWRAENGELVQALDGPSDIEWSAWHNTGGVILAGSSDGTVWMWLAATGQCMQVFAGHEGSVPCGNFTGDGRFVVTGGEDATVRVWGPKVGKCRHVFRSERGAPFHEGSITCLAPHKNGELLASGSEDGTVRLMHVTNQRVVALFVHTLPQPIEAPREEDKDDESEGDDYNEDDEPEMFDENELEVIDELDEEAGDDANRPEPSRDANRGNVIVEDEEVDVSEEDEGEVQEFTEASLSVESIDFCHTHKWMATGGMDGTMKIWDLGSNLCRHTCQVGGNVIKIFWHPMYPLVYSASTDGVVRLWSGQTGALLLTLGGHTDMILDMSVIFATNREEQDTIFTCSDDHTARIFTVDPHTHFNASANTPTL